MRRSSVPWRSAARSAVKPEAFLVGILPDATTTLVECQLERTRCPMRHPRAYAAENMLPSAPRTAGRFGCWHAARIREWPHMNGGTMADIIQTPGPTNTGGGGSAAGWAVAV